MGGECWMRVWEESVEGKCGRECGRECGNGVWEESVREGVGGGCERLIIIINTYVPT